MSIKDVSLLQGMPRAGSGVVRIDPFPGWMLYKATKPGLVCLSYLSIFFCVVTY